MQTIVANQSLLAGLYSYIHGFVSLDSLTYAAERSALRPDGDPLATLLERGLLDENQRKLVLEMAAASESSFGSADSALDNSPPLRAAFEQLHQSLEKHDRNATKAMDVGRSTDHGSDAANSDGQSSKSGNTLEFSKPEAPAADPGDHFDAPSPSVSATADYLLKHEHAHGGLGEVYLAWDNNLDRSVAVKRIRSAHARDRALRARFLREAQITAKLEHPSIVPVHTIGVGSDGRAFYVMRMIHGETLSSSVQAYHQNRSRARTSRVARIELRRLLGQFVAVCNAISYAHSHGVIHRDIKPSNIMLGRFGETFVVDWGLAKVLTSAAPELLDWGGSAVRAPEPGAEAYTQFGSAVGTTYYMSPEQAAGSLDQVGPASDIYNLGATLYEILTGAPPFADRDRGLVLDEIQRGTCRSPRELNKEISPKLDAICRKAMAVAPADRYASSAALAADIESWLADEPIIARRETATERAMRWSRKHPATLTGAAALLVSAVVALGAGMIAVNAERDQTEGARQQAQRNYDEAQKARIVAETARREAVSSEGIARQEAKRANQEAERANAETLVAKATSDFVIGLFRSSDPFNRGRLAPSVFDASNRHLTARQILDHAAEDIPVKLANYPDAKAEMMSVVGDVLRRLSSYEKARMLLEEALSVQRQRLKPTDPAIAATLRSLAQWHLNQRTFQEAEPLLQESLRIVEANSPVDLDTMLSTRLNIVWALMATRRLAEAKVEAAKIHELLVQKLGKDSIELRVLTSLLTAEIDDTVRMVQNQFIRSFAELSRDDLVMLLGMLKRLVFAQMLGDRAGLEKALAQMRQETRRMLGDRNWTEPFLILYAADTAEARGEKDVAKAHTLAAMDLSHQVFGDGSVWSTSFDYQAGRRLARLEAFPEAEQAFRASIASAQGTVLVTAYQDYVLRIHCDLLAVLVKTGQVEKQKSAIAEIRRLRADCMNRHSQGLAHSFMLAGNSLVEAGWCVDADWVLQESVRSHDIVRQEIKESKESMTADATRDRFRDALLAVLDVDSAEDITRFSAMARSLLAESKLHQRSNPDARSLLDMAINDYESVTPRDDDEIARIRAVAAIATQLVGNTDKDLRQKLFASHRVITSAPTANRVLLAMGLSPMDAGEKPLAEAWLTAIEKKKISLEPSLKGLLRFRMGAKDAIEKRREGEESRVLDFAAAIELLSSFSEQNAKDQAKALLLRVTSLAAEEDARIQPAWIPAAAVECLIREVIGSPAD